MRFLLKLVHRTCVSVCVSVPDDVGMVELLESFEQRHLSHRGQRKAVLIGLHSHTLQSHKLPAVSISSLVDGPVSAAADLCHRLVLQRALLRHDLQQTAGPANNTS